jgi:hypothetical protein
MARTAVVAGTATAVSNRVSRRQANRWARNDQSAYADSQYPPQYAQPQYAPPPQQYAPPPQYAQPQYAQPQYASPPPAAPVGGPDAMLEQLRQLGALRDQGILTDAEFAAQKAKILAG